MGDMRLKPEKSSKLQLKKFGHLFLLFVIYRDLAHGACVLLRFCADPTGLVLDTGFIKSAFVSITIYNGRLSLSLCLRNR